MDKIRQFAVLLIGALLGIQVSYAATDTVRVMSYNVLYYGDNPACQGSHAAAHNYLKTVVSYANPDILGLVKMAAIPMFSGDHSGSASAGFADSILTFALNAAFPGRYAYCAYTNSSTADNISILFYDKQKFGFSGITSSYVNVTDFNTYKLYYKSASLAATHDTVFLYVTLNHTESGSGSSNEAIRGAQITGEMAQIQTHFAQLPNMINMGDFNTHSSAEACYQALVAPSNAAFRFYDPPFSVDGTYGYPADWDTNPSSYASCLTTSTRLSGSIPNSCGTSGGGKSWYDHIFLSGSIINNTLNIEYIPHSYKTVGNDGQRTNISVNDLPTNTSAPAAVISAIFQMSNKYPVMADLAITSASVSVDDFNVAKASISVANPVGDILHATADKSLLGKTIRVQYMDMSGRCIFDSEFTSYASSIQMPFDAPAGFYFIRFTAEGRTIANLHVVKKSNGN